jgi:uncharacterized SAM-dependent methyltransferase
MGLRQQVLDAMEGGRPFPPHLFYASDQGVRRWLALSEDPLFVAYQDSMDLVYGSSDDIAREILRLTGSQDIDLISLGLGDGRKDSALLGSLLRLAGGRVQTFYYPFDISSNMVAQTMERIARDRVIRDGLAQAKAVIADFGSLPIFKPVYQYRDGPNVLILLGNMLGNFSDDFGFLKRLHDRAMLQQDALLLEVRLRSHTEELEDMARHHTPQTATHFDFGPLELLGIQFQEDLLSYSFERDRGTLPFHRHAEDRAKYLAVILGDHMPVLVRTGSCESFTSMSPRALWPEALGEIGVLEGGLDRQLDPEQPLLVALGGGEEENVEFVPT